MKRLFVLSILVVLLAACGQLSGDVLTFRTADPTLSIDIKLLPAPTAIATATVEIPTATATATEEPLLPTVTPTPECVNAKGNINAAGEKIYHMPGQANYNTVKIDKDGEEIFCTEQEAIDAGFRKSLR